MFMMSFVFVIVLNGSESVSASYSFFFFVWRRLCSDCDPVIKRRADTLLIGVTTPQVCVCPQSRPGFPMRSTVIFFVFSGLR